jgi:uncharacterized protein (TIGR03000 family)
MNNPYYWSGGGTDADSSAPGEEYSDEPGDPAPIYPDGYTSGGVKNDGDRSNTPAPLTTPAAPDNRAHVTVRVPAGAQVWFDDRATTQTGTFRQYQSPPLTPGEHYTYEVRARWQQDGREVTQSKNVSVTAGSYADVNFPLPPSTDGRATSAKGS